MFSINSNLISYLLFHNYLVSGQLFAEFKLLSNLVMIFFINMKNFWWFYLPYIPSRIVVKNLPVLSATEIFKTDYFNFLVILSKELHKEYPNKLPYKNINFEIFSNLSLQIRPHKNFGLRTTQLAII